MQCSELDGADVLMIKGDMEVYKPDMHVIVYTDLVRATPAKQVPRR